MDRKYDAHPNCLVFFALILFCILFACLMMVITGTATLSISGFAVDSSDRLYVGMQKEICVYENGTIIDRLSPHTSRTYIFTITEDDTILLSTSTTIYVMDLKGNMMMMRTVWTCVVISKIPKSLLSTQQLLWSLPFSPDS